MWLQFPLRAASHATTRWLLALLGLLTTACAPAADWTGIAGRLGRTTGSDSGDPPAAAPMSDRDTCARLGACLDREHVARHHLDPAAILAAAATALHAHEARAVLAADADGWTLRFDGAVIARLAGDPSHPAAAPQTLAGIGRWLDTVTAALAHAGLANDACRGLAVAMLNAGCDRLDAYTRWLPPARARALDEDIAGCFGGIGAGVIQRAGGFVFSDVDPGQPAARAGIHPGDRLLAVAGLAVAGCDADTVAARIHGPVATTVVLTVAHDPAGTPVDFAVPRVLIPLPVLRARRVGDAGYLRLDLVSADSARAVQTAILLMQDEGPRPLAGLVLDLRGNRGGLVQQAIALGSLFLPHGALITSLHGADGPDNDLSNRDRPSVQLPLAVLVSGRTASAAELLAGALQCHDRAALIGTVTFGKGLVQDILRLDDGGTFKYSVAEYLLPGGWRVQSLGLMPDIALGPVGQPAGAKLAPAMDHLGGARFLAAPAVQDAAPAPADPEPSEDAAGLIVPDAAALRALAVAARTRGDDRAALVAQWRKGLAPSAGTAPAPAPAQATGPRAIP